MLNFKAIDHININVKNLEESIDFYHKVFNFEVKEQGKNMRGNSYAIIGIHDKGMLALNEKPNFKFNEDANINHLGFNIEYYDGIFEDLKKAGIKLNYYNESGVVEYPNSKSIYVEDPNGNEIELSSNFGGGL